MDIEPAGAFPCNKDNLLLFIDEGKVDQVIRNLLTNAVS